MDIRDMLEREHREVERDLELLDESGYQDEDLLRKVLVGIETHAEVEERVVYPALARLDDALATRSWQEHDLAREIIARIRSAGLDECLPHCEALADTVLTHVEEEESQVFPELAKLGRKRLEELAGEAAEARAALVRPAVDVVVPKAEEEPAPGP